MKRRAGNSPVPVPTPTMNPSSRNPLPKRTASRALIYLRVLAELVRRGRAHVSSRELAEMTGLTDVQIRRDLTNFPVAGRPRVGYETGRLQRALERRLHPRPVRVALFGVGHLGTAILKYPEYHTSKIKLVAAFDLDRRKAGRAINGVTIHRVHEAGAIIRRCRAGVGIIAVPAAAAQEIAVLIARCGIRRILNFSPSPVTVPAGVVVRNVDLTVEFLSLSCGIHP